MQPEERSLAILVPAIVSALDLGLTAAGRYHWDTAHRIIRSGTLEGPRLTSGLHALPWASSLDPVLYH